MIAIVPEQIILGRGVIVATCVHELLEELPRHLRLTELDDFTRRYSVRAGKLVFGQRLQATRIKVLSAVDDNARVRNDVELHSEELHR